MTHRMGPCYSLVLASSALSLFSLATCGAGTAERNNLACGAVDDSCDACPGVSVSDAGRCSVACSGSGACRRGGVYGCYTSSDCLLNLAGDQATDKCGTACDGVGSLCTGGGCNGEKCASGTGSTSECGYNGELCSTGMAA